MFKKWAPEEIFWYVVVPVCAMLIILLVGPKACEMDRESRTDRLLKECIERHSPEQCRHIIKEEDK